jgi:hypothetical protein
MKAKSNPLGPESKLFKPGETVRISGIYEVLEHKNNHKTNHQITCVKETGHKFPPCRDCGKGIRFRLVYKAEHIKDDKLFKDHYAA